MEKKNGKSVFEGIAIGMISFFQKGKEQVKRMRIQDAKEEWERFEQARKTAIEQLGVLYKKAIKKVGEESAMIFEIHQMMLEDKDYLDSVRHKIESQMINAEYAVLCTGEDFSAMFRNMEDAYMKERAADVKDISDRIIHILQGREEKDIIQKEPYILAAQDLAPSETIQMDKRKVLAFVTRHGSMNSHTAILARTMNIPALVQVDFSEEIDGKLAIVDGYKGLLILEPDEKTVEKYREQKRQEDRKRQLLQEMKGKETITKDGKKIELYANIGNIEDAMSAVQNDAEGIGLFRSEFLYLEKDSYPTEEEQFEAYKAVAETMKGKKVIIRTLDIGADKRADYFGIEPEENPAMGFRAIRICLKRPEIFKTQLRALYRASMYGTISILFPMIISLDEVRAIKSILEEVKNELTAQQIPYQKDVEIGIMIETPAAVLISDLLAKEVDFFSIGTNDLTQYTLAIDRQNINLDDFYDSHHPAILRMIQTTVENGHKEGCFVGICGELGADLSFIEELLKSGVDELSVAPSSILPVREKICSIALIKDEQ